MNKKELNAFFESIYPTKEIKTNVLNDLLSILSSSDIRQITGYSKEAVRKWIKSEKLLGVVSRKRFVVAKDDLIEFLSSEYYVKIIRKSKDYSESYSRKHLSQIQNADIRVQTN